MSSISVSELAKNLSDYSHLTVRAMIVSSFQIRIFLINCDNFKLLELMLLNCWIDLDNSALILTELSCVFHIKAAIQSVFGG